MIRDLWKVWGKMCYEVFFSCSSHLWWSMPYVGCPMNEVTMVASMGKAKIRCMEKGVCTRKAPATERNGPLNVTWTKMWVDLMLARINKEKINGKQKCLSVRTLAPAESWPMVHPSEKVSKRGLWEGYKTSGLCGFSWDSLSAMGGEFPNGAHVLFQIGWRLRNSSTGNKQEVEVTCKIANTLVTNKCTESSSHRRYRC